MPKILGSSIPTITLIVGVHLIDCSVSDGAESECRVNNFTQVEAVFFYHTGVDIKYFVQLVGRPCGESLSSQMKGGVASRGRKPEVLRVSGEDTLPVYNLFAPGVSRSIGSPRDAL